MNAIRLFIFTLFVLLGGCVYHQSFEQGNILSTSKTQQIHAGMSVATVESTLGSPVLKNIYDDQRMTYVYSQQPTRNTTIVHHFIVHFYNGRVTTIESDVS